MKKSVLLSAPLLVFALTCLPPAAPELLAGNQQGPAWNQAKAKNRQKQQQQQAAQAQRQAETQAQKPAEKPKRRWFSRKAKETAPAPAAEHGQPDATLLPGGSGNGDIPPPDLPPGADLPPPSPAAPEAAAGPASALKTPHARFIPSEDLLDQALTGAGPVDEDGLILLAIKNNYRLTRLRAEVAISQARKKGAHALPNPELRIGYVTDRDSRLMRAYTERSTERIRTRERYNSFGAERNLAPEGLRGFGDYQNQRETGEENTTRYRTIERRVTLGRYTDTVETNVYETRSDRLTRRTSRNGLDEFTPENTEESAREGADRQLLENYQETIRHPDEYTRDDEISFLVRFDLPNPWELHARIQVAAAEIARAESEYLIEEDRVILEVRERFEELLRLESRARTRGAIRRQAEKGRTDVESRNDPELADLASDLRLDVSALGLDIRKIQGDIRQLREELAVLCGLNNPNRIRLPDRLNRRTVNAGNLNVDYLTSLALLHRSDVLDLHARRQLAQAQLKEANALKIPVASFFDVGWARATTERRTGENEEFLVRMGITIPFFDWVGVNQTHKEFKTAAAVYERQIGDRQRLITVEIQQAIGRIRRAEQELGTLEGELKQLNTSAERSLRETKDDVNDSARATYKIDQLRTRFDEERFETWSEYNKAVMDLERALGCRLEKALSSNAPLPK